jgi:DNA modification methylase
MSSEIIVGDCLSIMKSMGDGSVDLVVTDPPFKVSQMYGGGVDADNLINVAGILRTFPEISRILKEGRFFVCFYDNRILPFLFEATKGTELIYRKSIYLYRRWGSANRWLGWMQTTDPICFFVKGHSEPFMPTDMRGKVKHDVYIKSKPEIFNAHTPAQKPLELLKDIVQWCSNEGELVLDPYAGSGTSCLAAKSLGRRYIGIEINEEYASIAKTRLNNPNTESIRQTVLSNDEAKAGPAPKAVDEK